MQQDNSQKTPKIGQKPQDRVVMQALSMAFGTMTSRILGLFRDMAFAAMFSRTITDAWGVAFRIPNMFRRLLGEGSLSVSFIPVFIEAKNQDPSGARAHNLVNGFYSLLLIVLGVLTALGILFAEPMVGLLVDLPFHEIPGKFELTVRMTQIMFGFIFLMSTYAFFMGILNALGQFALPAVAPTFFNIAMIIANFVPKEWQPVEGDALAWGVMVGGFLQTVILIPALIRADYFPKLQWQGMSQDIAKVWKNMIPGALGMGLLQITTIVNTNFASRLGEGSNTFIYLADRLLELPLSLVSVSLGTALLPTLASLWSQGEKQKTVETANYYLRLNLFVSVPAALGLYYLAHPIVQLLFENGKFTAADSLMTASVVQIYAFTLIISSSVRVLVPSYYAVKNTWFPAVVSAVCLVAHILIAPWMMRMWGIQGLVASTLVSASLNLSSLLIFYPRFIAPLGYVKIFVSFFKFCVAGVVLAGVCRLYPYALAIYGNFGLGVRIPRLLSVFSIIGFAALAYCVVSYLLRTEELHHTLNSLLGKIRRRLKKSL
ncbi:MAG: murein biosynthesis integral membrane protein MurJ [Pseudobdellovibrionaceae bacterium]